MEIGWEEGESKNAQKNVGCTSQQQQSWKSRYAVLQPSNFQEIALQMRQRYAANNLFIQIYPGANTAYDQFLDSQT